MLAKPQNKPPEQGKAKKKNKLLPWLLLILLSMIIPGLYQGLLVQNYTIQTEAVTKPIRIALLTDLHSCPYGDNAGKLIAAIDGQSPDVVVMVGDMFDEYKAPVETEYLLQGICEKYPCYYVTGNHEFYSDKQTFSEYMAIIDKYGITRLAGTMETITIKGQSIAICGVDDPCGNLIDGSVSFTEQLTAVTELAKEQDYSILLSHRPEFAELYGTCGFDLVLCGHAHGGQWRIPGVLNGLYAPDQGFFPKYAGGFYQMQDTPVIVGRGLTTQSPPVPRFYDRPELVIIDLQ